MVCFSPVGFGVLMFRALAHRRSKIKGNELELVRIGGDLEATKFEIKGISCSRTCVLFLCRITVSSQD